LSLRTGVEYVAAVYLIAWLVILGYVFLIGRKLGRLEREVEQLEHGGAEAPVAERPTADVETT
jgi:CcmD family protein